MDSQLYSQIVSFIWGIADDCLRDIYVRGKYRDVILPMTVIRQRIRHSHIKASLRVNITMNELYWSIGADIVKQQAEAKWGSGVIKQLSKELKKELPDIEGFSETNLRYMKRFYIFYNQQHTIQRQVGAILDKTTKTADHLEIVTK